MTCENVEDFDYKDAIGVQSTCFMNGTTSIASPRFTMAARNDETNAVTALRFSKNLRVQYLPTDTYKSYLDLVVIHANQCFIKSISRSNFRNLRRLRDLELANNQIKRIYDDTFIDLEALENLYLGKLSKFTGELEP